MYDNILYRAFVPQPGGRRYLGRFGTPNLPIHKLGARACSRLEERYKVTDMLSVLASVAALIISIVALWRAYFARFRPLILTGDLFFKIFPIKDSGAKWYIPSATVTISVANEGARPGAVLGLRLVATYPKKISVPHYEVLAPAFDLDATMDEVIGENRFSWLKEHSTGNWKPIVIPTGGTITKRLVFETRWDNPIAPDLMVLSLEIFSNANKHWTKVNEWEIPLRVKEWAFFTGHDGGMRFPPKNDVLIWREQKPDNLHSQIIYRGPVPASWLRDAEPSFLAYDDENNASENGESA